MPLRLKSAADLARLGKPGRVRKAAALVAPSSAVTLTVVVPVRVVSEANQRCHWAARHRRFKKQADALDAALWPLPMLETLRVFQHMIAAAVKTTVTLTRLGGKGLDGDNLASAFKGLRDRLAWHLAVDDGDPIVTWLYGQEPGGPVGVRITISTGEGS